MSTSPLRSPVPWMGGKHAMAPFLLKAFPPKEAYDLYGEPFMGGCHVIAQKPAWKHYEVINDLDGDLVNFWMQLRDHPADLAARLDTLPYARLLHADYHRSLQDGTLLDPLERACRWFYVVQSSFSSHLKQGSMGWKHGPRNPQRGVPHSYHAALDLFAALSQRLRYVEIDQRDFEVVITQHQSARTLFYIDPPYLGVEDYYQRTEGAFTLSDHERLATVLSKTPALVALSTYDHPQMEQWYPRERWRWLRWHTVKHAQRAQAARDPAVEVLICNYPAPATTLWESQEEATLCTHP